MPLNRRHFLQSGLMAGLAAPQVLAQILPRAVIVGGGPGGAMMARLLVQMGLRVTLIEPNKTYKTCFMSNHYLAGLRDLASVSFGYGALISQGIELLPDSVTGIDAMAKTVRLASGQTQNYDILVLATGVEFIADAIPGWDADVMPHAYGAGGQIEKLRAQLESMPQGGIFAMIAPPNPYRCPPAPYERVSMVAHRLNQINPTAKILVFDPKDHYSKQTHFENGWGKYYNGMITWVGPDFGGGDIELRADTMQVLVEGEAQRVDVCNVIPAQRAGHVAKLAGVTDATGWAPVDPFNFRSRIDPAIFVLGDSAAQGAMPKSAFAAQEHAFAAAAAIRADMTGVPAPAPSYANSCWSMIAPDDGVKIVETFHATPDQIVSDSFQISAPDEPPAIRAATAAEGMAWYDAFTTQIFE